MASAAHSANYSISCGQPVAEPGTVFKRVGKSDLSHDLSKISHADDPTSRDHLCTINVTANDVYRMRARQGYWNYWKFMSGPPRSSPDRICMDECKERCANDKYQVLLIKRAEKGTVIQVFNTKDNTIFKDYATIEVLKNINGQKTKKLKPYDMMEFDGIMINGFERSRTTEYYKVTYHHVSGSLNNEISSITVGFPHRS